VQLESFRFRRVNVYLKNVMTTSTVRPNENNRLAAIGVKFGLKRSKPLALGGELFE